LLLSLHLLLLLPLPVLFQPNGKIVISTEAAHAFVSSAVEKSASLLPQFAQPNTAHLLLQLLLALLCR